MATLSRMVACPCLAVVLTACAAEPSPAATSMPTPLSTATTQVPLSSPAATATLPGVANTPTPVQPAPTVACPAVTQALTEGPYFKNGAPERTSLSEEGVTGTKLVISGRVLTRTCQPVADARLEFWQADAQGAYDNSGYRLRGYQMSAADGSYHLETIVPGLYPGRTRHIHFKVIAAKRATLVSQLFFPNEPGNATDGICETSLVLPVEDTADGKTAVMDYILDIG